MKNLDFYLTQKIAKVDIVDFLGHFFSTTANFFGNEKNQVGYETKENIWVSFLEYSEDETPDLRLSCTVYAFNNFALNTTEEEFAFACAKRFGCEVVFFQPEGKIEGFEAIRYFADGHKDCVNLIQGDEHDYLSTQPILPYRD